MYNQVLSLKDFCLVESIFTCRQIFKYLAKNQKPRDKYVELTAYNQKYRYKPQSASDYMRNEKLV